MGKRRDDVAVINWRDYHGRSAVFPVCMKSPAVNGRSLRAQMSAARQRIDHLIIVLCDSLDRHNMFHLSDAKAHCMEAGDIWLAANMPVVKEYFPTVEVIRWEYDIRTHSSFEGYLKKVQDLYFQSAEVRELRDTMSLYYLRSKMLRFEADYKNGLAKTFDIDLALQSSADYLDEEFAGDMVYHEITNGLPHIYWGLYVDDHDIFNRASGRALPFPMTLPVVSQRHGRSLAASELPNSEAMRSAVQLNVKAIAA